MSDIISLYNPSKILIPLSILIYFLFHSRLESDSDKFIADKEFYYETVDKFITGARVDKYTSENSIRITLPFSQQKNFAALFKELESDQNIRVFKYIIFIIETIYFENL